MKKSRSSEKPLNRRHSISSHWDPDSEQLGTANLVPLRFLSTFVCHTIPSRASSLNSIAEIRVARHPIWGMQRSEWAPTTWRPPVPHCYDQSIRPRTSAERPRSQTAWALPLWALCLVLYRPCQWRLWPPETSVLEHPSRAFCTPTPESRRTPGSLKARNLSSLDIESTWPPQLRLENRSQPRPLLPIGRTSPMLWRSASWCERHQTWELWLWSPRPLRLIIVILAAAPALVAIFCSLAAHLDFSVPSWAFRDTHVVDEPYGLGLLTAVWSEASFTTAPGRLTLGSTTLEPAPNPRSVKRLLKTVFLPFWTMSNKILIWSCLDARRAFDFSEPGSAGIISKTLDPASSSKSRTIQNSDLDKPTSQIASTNGWSKTGKDKNFLRALSIWAELGYRSDSQGSWHPLSR